MTTLPPDEALKEAVLAIDRVRILRTSTMEQLLAALRALDAAGYAVVPKVATQEMETAGYKRFMDLNRRRGCTPGDEYSAMLAAAPKLTEGNKP